MAHASLYTGDLCEARFVSDPIITWFPFDEPPPRVYKKRLRHQLRLYAFKSSRSRLKGGFSRMGRFDSGIVRAS